MSLKQIFKNAEKESITNLDANKEVNKFVIKMNKFHLDKNTQIKILLKISNAFKNKANKLKYSQNIKQKINQKD